MSAEQQQQHFQDGAQDAGDEFQLPEVSIIGHSVSLVFGMARRGVVAGGVGPGIYARGDAIRGTPGSGWERAKAKNKMWAPPFARELIPSLLLVPGRYLTGRTVPRLVGDFAFPGLGQFFGLIDRFSPGHYISYSMNRLTPAGGAESDLSFFLWHLPATVVTAAKLYVRRQNKPAETKTKRCVAMLAAQYVSRLLMISFSVYLPSSEKEMLLAVLLTAFDRYSDAYLIRNTWPFDDEVAAEEKQ